MGSCSAKLFTASKKEDDFAPGLATGGEKSDSIFLGQLCEPVAAFIGTVAPFSGVREQPRARRCSEAAETAPNRSRVRCPPPAAASAAVGACAAALPAPHGSVPAMALRLLRGAPGAAKSSLCLLRSSSSSKTGGRSEPAKQPLKKPKLPVGRFDEPEETSVEKEPLEKFPDGINPTTKERGGPRGPEPTRFGDWERKGRCIDF
ncbi:succinate dehydrogenase assembly factor 4, mitochondrial [Malurus melanocephalus]|uniref:succinate dehydrogenase assembly factor 4, mitochondrial n=1 Tax=Malurus melanocephalus TaxID=175006 RepID=UPI0025476D75|nr:succinate dehydrogenase assembly factor 4, mitochondrial [Malurus melanocephalus]